MGYESLTEFSVNQGIIIYFTVHKCMPKNFQGYLGNKVTFLKWEDNGLLLANFIEFFCRVLIRHYCNKFRKLIAKYSNDSKDHKGYKPKRILPLRLCDAFFSEILTRLSNCLSLFDTELMKREWMERFRNLSKFVNHNGTKMVDVRVLNVNKLSEAWTKMKVGKLRVRAPQ